MHLRSAHVDKTRLTVADRDVGLALGALVKESELDVVRSGQSEPAENVDVCEDEARNLETSFKHLCVDLDWKDTRRYPNIGSAPQRKLCMLTAYCLCVVFF